MTFTKWTDRRPDDLHQGQVLLWRTEHVRLKVGMVISGAVRKMHDGWKNTDNLMPPMTRWDGYRHLIPADLEWAHAPSWIKENATYKSKNRWGYEITEVNSSRLVRLLEVEGVILCRCPFCGGEATWESRDGFIGAMPHEENQFSVGCCLRTAFRNTPSAAAAFWNRRHEGTLHTPESRAIAEGGAE